MTDADRFSWPFARSSASGSPSPNYWQGGSRRGFLILIAGSAGSGRSLSPLFLCSLSLSLPLLLASYKLIMRDGKNLSHGCVEFLELGFVMRSVDQRPELFPQLRLVNHCPYRRNERPQRNHEIAESLRYLYFVAVVAHASMSAIWRPGVSFIAAEPIWEMWDHASAYCFFSFSHLPLMNGSNGSPRSSNNATPDQDGYLEVPWFDSLLGQNATGRRQSIDSFGLQLAG